MIDLIAAIVLGVFVPTILLFILSALTLIIWSAYFHNQFQWQKLKDALAITLLIQIFLVSVGGLLIGAIAGRALGYAFPITIVLLALLASPFSFFYFLAKGVPTDLRWQTWFGINN